MKKIFKVLAFSVMVFILCVIVYIYVSTPRLPENTDQVLEEVLKSELPDLVRGETGFVVNDSLRIWYESISPADTAKDTILLFMGISNDALGWPQAFLEKFVRSGYQVIRFDYRGTGLSDWVDDWEERPYSLLDLATDSKIILDSLGINKVNLLGISLGGMVAQEFAINFPDRTRSLTSMMSSGNILDEELPPISSEVVFDLVKCSMKYGMIPTDKNNIKLHLASRIILRGDAKYDIDVVGTAQQVLYNIRERKGYNSNASSQHHEATYRSGSRYSKLKDLDVPVLIIHGLNDPFIPIEHSMKLAKVIPGSKSKWLENMGHDIPLVLIDSIHEEMNVLMNSNEDY